jgi:ATP-dependent DNA helicase UvrD/PcrA
VYFIGMSKTELVRISGNTFPVKEDLKRLGARWNGAEKCWMVPAERAEQARALVAGTLALPRRGVDVPAAPRADVSWSDEQKAIFAWFASGTGNLQVKARAGTGKTTTIKEAFAHAPEEGRLLYAVFNKKNQREAMEKITDPRVDVRTLHSLGYFFIKNFWRDAKPDDDVESYRLTQVAPTLPEEVSAQVLKLVGFCKNLTTGIPDVNLVIEIADARGISVPDGMERDFSPARIADLAIEVLKQSLIRDHSSRVSFNDMVWLPVAAGWVKPTFSLVVVDEAQDMSMPQLMMAERACKQGGRICIVGDDRQAIYGFRGAASDGMHLMQQRLNAATLGLTTTYRCPKYVVALANTIVADYTAAPSAPEGEIIVTDLSEAVKTLVVGDAVLSRLNAPLMGICLSLLRKGTSARIEGRDIGKQLVGMVRKLRAKSVPDFLRKLNAWGDKQKSRIAASGGKYANSKIELVNDQVLTLEIVAQDCENVLAVETKILSLFEDSDNTRKPAVVCSTVHKAKGLEWDKVCLVEDSFKNKSSEGEEANIFYVAVTRAKKVLVRAGGKAESK